jgi:hypothetical protein
MARRLVPAAVLVALAGCINPHSTDCSRGAWLGGAAGTDRCLPTYRPYANEPWYQLGLGGTYTDPQTGMTYIVPARPGVTAEHLRHLDRARERARPRPKPKAPQPWRRR